MKIALLSPAFPVTSETFVFREAQVLEALRHEVLPFGLRPSANPPLEARELAERCDVLYRSTLAVLRDATLFALRRPRSAARTALRTARDWGRGEFVDRRARAILPLQLVAGLALAQRLQAAEAEHLHVHFAHASATVGMIAAQAADLPLSIVGHARDLFVDGSLLAEKVARADLFATISEQARTELRERIGTPDAAVEIHRCGVDLSQFRPDATQRVPGRVVAVGRLVPKKGFDLLIDALAGAGSPEAHLFLVGDGPERESLAALVRRRGLDTRVTFVGAAGGDEVRALVQTASVFALPCRRATDGDTDGIPVALMEAMACAVPVLTTSVGGIAELVRDGETGRIVPVDDAVALCGAIDGLVRDPQRAVTLGRAGRALVERERNLWENTALLSRILREGQVDPAPGTSGPGSMPDRRVLLVTPARDEVEHLPRLADALLAQTCRPTQWIIVDDGSTDGTLAVAERLSRSHDWIHVVARGDRGRRQLGGGVIESFDAGLAAARDDFDFVGKLDADMSFRPDYLHAILREFDRDPRLGSASGKVYRPEPGGAVEEFMIDDMVAGQFKLYRRACFADIGGLERAVMWDGIDFHRARMHGWRTRSIARPELRLMHHRLMGSSDGNVLRGRLRWGRGQWFMGSHPLYLLASAALRMLERPRLIGGLLIAAGYVDGCLRRAPRYGDVDFRSDLRRWQILRLRRLVLRGEVR